MSNPPYGQSGGNGDGGWGQQPNNGANNNFGQQPGEGWGQGGQQQGGFGQSPQSANQPGPEWGQGGQQQGGQSQGGQSFGQGQPQGGQYGQGQPQGGQYGQGQPGQYGQGQPQGGQQQGFGGQQGFGQQPGQPAFGQSAGSKPNIVAIIAGVAVAALVVVGAIFVLPSLLGGGNPEVGDCIIVVQNDEGDFEHEDASCDDPSEEIVYHVVQAESGPASCGENYSEYYEEEEGSGDRRFTACLTPIFESGECLASSGSVLVKVDCNAVNAEIKIEQRVDSADESACSADTVPLVYELPAPGITYCATQP